MKSGDCGHEGSRWVNKRMDGTDVDGDGDGDGDGDFLLGRVDTKRLLYMVCNIKLGGVSKDSAANL